MAQISNPVLGKLQFSPSVTDASAPANPRRGAPPLPSAPPTRVSEAVQLSRVEAFSASEKIAFQLELVTNEGDQIKLDFSSLAYQSQVQLSRAGDSTASTTQSLTEQLQISVQGDLSAEEQQALDSLLQSIERVAEEFFTDNPEMALREIANLQFDPGQLSSLSLDLSLSKTTEYVRVAQGGDATGGVWQHNNVTGAFEQLLQDLAQRQKQLIQEAKEVLQPVSAARLVRNLLPVYLGQATGSSS